MTTSSQLINYDYNSKDRHYQDVFDKGKSVNRVKGQFDKLNKTNSINYDLGDSQMLTNNLSRRNSGATKISTLYSTNSTVNVRTTQNKITKCSNHTSTTKLSSRQPQKSWSLPHIANDNCELTEQRCNYERMIQRQEPWSSEQVVRCHISNSRIPTNLIELNQRNGTDYTAINCSDTINDKFLALREFRIQNSRECFGDHRHQKLQLTRTQTPQKASVGSCDHKVYYTLNWCTGKNCKLFKDNANIAKPSTMPYAARQRLLRERLAKELPKNSKMQLAFQNMGLNKSIALSYQSMY